MATIDTVSVSPPSHQALSSSVDSVRRKHQLTGELSAFAIARELLAIHPEYGRGRPRPNLEGEPPRAERRSVEQWLGELQALYGPSARMLDGRRALFGLALLEPRLARRLRRSGFLHTLEAEIDPPVPSSLSPLGLEAYEKLAGKAESVPLLSDRPATVDQLNRAAFAEALADRIRQIHHGDCRPGAFLAHIYAPWGAGKTSLLHFIGEALRQPGPENGGAPAEAEDRWIVVTFNAWEHQRIAPPWWWLMTAVYRGALADLRSSRRWGGWLKLHAWDLWWRFKDGWSAYVFFPLALLGLWLLWKHGMFGEQGADVTTAAKDAATLLGVIVTVWGLVHGISRWLLLGSPRGAVTVLQRTRDPMGIVKRRFEFLIDKIESPVAIFIDDLDRCQGAYIVELLEGIQTLFADARVTYVVTADRGWICESFAKIYADFAKRIDEPGRPLGYHFLEKTFQLSVAMPRMTPALRRGYLARLLDLEGARQSDDHLRARQEAERLFAHLSSEQEVRTMLEHHAGDFRDEAALRQAAVRRLASAEVREQTEHMLGPFADLLESNPRAMKRLINAYGVESAVQLLQGDEISGERIRMEQLVLWTILMMRWPILADYLALHPHEISAIRNGTAAADVPAELAPLLREDDVRDVVLGNADGVDAQLDEEAVRAYAGLSETDRLEPASAAPAAPAAPAQA